MRTRVRGVVQGASSGRADLSDIVKAIQKQHGNTTIKVASEARQPIRLSTGIFTLDLALCGGLFMNCINEFLGARSSGKTTALLKAIASAQRQYPSLTPALVDAEHTFDPVWAGKLGVDLDHLILVQPSTGEEAVDQVQGLMSHAGISMVALDSVAALVPMKEVDAATEDAHVGIHAKLVTRLVRKANTAISDASKAGRPMMLLVTNQQRAGIGKWAPPGQEAISNPGGKALEHYTALQVKFKNKENLKKDEEGFDMLDVNEHAFSVDKNKFNAGMRKGEYLLRRSDDDDLGLSEGDIDDAESMLGFAKKMGIYTGGGSSWTLELPDYSETMRGREAWVAHLYANRDIHLQLRNHLIALHAVKLGMPQYFVDAIYEQA